MDKALIQIQKNLESIRRVTRDENPMEFWSARDLMPLLGYTTWAKFTEAIERSKESVKTSGREVEGHFLPAPAKSSGGRPKEEKELNKGITSILLE